jgi:hypothetical protein
MGRGVRICVVTLVTAILTSHCDAEAEPTIADTSVAEEDEEETITTLSSTAPKPSKSTRRTEARTTVTTASTSSTTNAHFYGGEPTKQAYEGWLSVWRSKYRAASPCGVVACHVPAISDALVPRALRGVTPKVILSVGGVAGGVVTEGMGYALMVEGFEASHGDKDAVQHGLGLMRSWLAMVQGPVGYPHPRGGGPNEKDSKSASFATEVESAPYGVSAIKADAESESSVGPSGVATWKWPLNQCDTEGGCHGSATDGDEDAVLGMIYLASAINSPDDFVDTVMRAVIAFASADLGFPEVYRTLPGGERVYVPKGGSAWGGVLPAKGRFKTTQDPWCYSPGYFAPAHYRIFREFVRDHWRSDFDQYLPPYLDGTPTTHTELEDAFRGAVIAGYNILYHSSCTSGTVSNWVGVEAACQFPEDLNCPGVPWAHTPYVGADQGKCSVSGTKWGSFGADASRVPWRIAMDFALFRKESADVVIYNRAGHVDKGVKFSAQIYLNRIVEQYAKHAVCDGGQPGKCFDGTHGSPYKLSYAFEPRTQPPNLTCDNVPVKPWTWWDSYMAYPTFTAFIAPHDDVTAEASSAWMDTFATICDFSGGEPKGLLCSSDYFEVSQALIATLIMSHRILPLPASKFASKQVEEDKVALHAQRAMGRIGGVGSSSVALVSLAFAAVALGIAGIFITAKATHLRRRSGSNYEHLHGTRMPSSLTDILSGPAPRAVQCHTGEHC